MHVLSCHVSHSFLLFVHPTHVKAAETTMRRQLTFWLRSLAFWKWFGFSASQVWVAHLGSYMPWYVGVHFGVRSKLESVFMDLWGKCRYTMVCGHCYTTFQRWWVHLVSNRHKLGTLHAHTAHTYIHLNATNAESWIIYDHGSYMTRLMAGWHHYWSFLYLEADSTLDSGIFCYMSSLRCLAGLILRELSSDGLRNVATTLE